MLNLWANPKILWVYLNQLISSKYSSVYCKLLLILRVTNTSKPLSLQQTLDEISAVSAGRQIYSLLSVKKKLSMWQYLICRQWPVSHRDQLRVALSILVLCVLITGVKKTDVLTECYKMKLSLSQLLSHSVPFVPFWCSGFFKPPQGAHRWKEHLGQRETLGWCCLMYDG